MGTAIIRIGCPRAEVNIRKLFAAHELRVIARGGVSRALEGLNQVSAKLAGMISAARGLALEIDDGVRLSSPSLELVLDHAIHLAARWGEDLKAIEISLDLEHRKVVVSPRTWSGERELRTENAKQGAYIAAQLEIDANLPDAKNKIGAEKVIAQILFKYFGVRGVKAYDVAPDGSVRISHAFLPTAAGEAKKIEHSGLGDSHFFNWVPPEAYMDEAMGEILFAGNSYVLIRDPEHDPLCVKTSSDGSEFRFESKPFALVGEKIAGKVTRVYKVDWEDFRALLSNSGLVIQGILHRLAEYKQKAAYEVEMGFLDRVSQIAAGEKDLDTALTRISEEIMLFFRENGKGSAAENVSIMLYDPLANVLVSRVRKDGNMETFQTGLDDPNIGVKIFNDGSTLYLRKVRDWKGTVITWGKGKEGALVGSVVKGKEGKKLGVIVVSSQVEDAFTQEQVRVLEEVSARVGPSFERIIEHMALLNLDQKFGNLGPEAKLFNPKYLNLRLLRDFSLHSRSGLPISILFCDIDNFKDVNETLGHEIADLVLKEVFLRTHNALRDGELYRHGGEEVAVRVNVNAETASLVGERIRKAIDSPITIRFNFNDRMAAAERIRSIREQMKHHQKSGIFNIAIEEARGGTFNLVITLQKTISVGIAEYQGETNPQELIDRADSAMRFAKSIGKNVVVAWKEGLA